MVILALLSGLFVIFSLGVLVRGVGQNRDPAGLEPSHDAPVEESEGDQARADRRDADEHPETRLSGYHWNLFI